MELIKILKIFKEKRQTIISIAVLFLLCILAFTFVQPFKYRATTKILIVQSNNLMDSYNISRSNQFLTGTLSEIVYSESFLEQVLESGFNIDNNIFSENPNKKMKQWKKIISARSFSDMGIIVVNTYHKDKYQAEQINRAVAYVLKSKHSLYHGLNDKVQVKIIDKTAVSDFPVKPNIILNVLLGIVFGVVLGFIFAYVFPEKNLKLWPTVGRRTIKDRKYVSSSVVTEEAVFAEPVREIAEETKYIEKNNLPKEELYYNNNFNKFNNKENNEKMLKGNMNNIFKY